LKPRLNPAACAASADKIDVIKGGMTQKYNNNGKEFALKTAASGRQGWGRALWKRLSRGERL
jgi:hypothetical protein